MAVAVAVAGDVEQVVGATRCCHLHGVHPGHPSTTHGQGASPCGHSRLPVVSLARRRPCSLVLPRVSLRDPVDGKPRVYVARACRLGPGGLGHSFSTMALTLLVGLELVADSGVTYHTTPNPSILSSIHPSSSLSSSIMVANGSCLPVTSVGAAGPHGFFCLPDVLVAPSMVHNLLSIRCKFTADNSCSVEFDSSGLTVKDLASWRPLL